MDIYRRYGSTIVRREYKIFAGEDPPEQAVSILSQDLLSVGYARLPGHMVSRFGIELITQAYAEISGVTIGDGMQMQLFSELQVHRDMKQIRSRIEDMMSANAEMNPECANLTSPIAILECMSRG